MTRRWEGGKTREQYRAWYAVKSAIKRGVLVRPETCSRCGRRPGFNKRGRSLIEAHHYRGYAPEHRLDVIFLCSACHKVADLLMEAPPVSGTAGGLIGRLRDLKKAREASGRVLAGSTLSD